MLMNGFPVLRLFEGDRAALDRRFEFLTAPPPGARTAVPPEKSIPMLAEPLAIWIIPMMPVMAIIPEMMNRQRLTGDKKKVGEISSGVIKSG